MKKHLPLPLFWESKKLIWKHGKSSGDKLAKRLKPTEEEEKNMEEQNEKLLYMGETNMLLIENRK